MDCRTPITTIDGVNQLPNASSNFAAAPMLASDSRLTEGSQCIDAGTSVAAPAVDLDGDPRDSRPDVGADEWVASD